jgi:hypothetical protein
MPDGCHGAEVLSLVAKPLYQSREYLSACGALAVSRVAGDHPRFATVSECDAVREELATLIAHLLSDRKRNIHKAVEVVLRWLARRIAP